MHTNQNRPAEHLRHIAPSALQENPFVLLDRDWMLVTVRDTETGRINTMTASWGGFGILWNKPVAFVFIRPERYTFALAERNAGLTLSFFSEEYRDALKLCGRVSGRDCDKIAGAGLTPMLLGDRAAFAEARTVMSCRKLYAEALKESAFADDALLQHYRAQGYHKMYIVEIEDIVLLEQQGSSAE